MSGEDKRDRKVAISECDELKSLTGGLTGASAGAIGLIMMIVAQ